MARVRLLVLGLDSVPPSILYGDVGKELVNLNRVLDVRGELLSSHPPITVPAWAVMLTGKTAGELGLYGFRHRRPGDVGVSYVASSRSVGGRWVWEVLGERGFRGVVVGVPPTFPPRPARGVWLVSCFLTPGAEKQFTWPPRLRGEVLAAAGGDYPFDVRYRSSDKEGVRRGLWRLAEKQFRGVRRLLATRDWDFAMYMHIGTDRVHHAFWKYWDRGHPRYPGEGNPYEDVIPGYYRLVDRLVGELLDSLPGGVEVLVVSDHGAKAMEGAFAINQWLAEQGYLKLRREPRKPGEELTNDAVDWQGTLAWAWGGYYSRVFVNLRGREPRGVVEPGEEYESLVEQLRRDLESLRGPRGEAWETRAYRPGELYPRVRGDAPDLMVYLDDLRWRAAGTLGWPTPYLEENDTGPDDAVHDWIGVIGGSSTLLKGKVTPGQPLPIQKVRDIILEYFGVEPPEEAET